MSKLVELVYCLCGELMKKEEIKDGLLPVCWKCQCNSIDEVNWKIKRKMK